MLGLKLGTYETGPKCLGGIWWSNTWGAYRKLSAYKARRKPAKKRVGCETKGRGGAGGGQEPHAASCAALFRSAPLRSDQSSNPDFYMKSVRL